jgi:uncharacterized protein YxjI
MAIALTCPCGQSYSLKNELAGKLVQCRECGDNLKVGGNSPGLAPAPPPKNLQAFSDEVPGEKPHRAIDKDPAFNRDKFLLRQKVLTIAEKYDVCDEQGKPILYIERPLHFVHNVTAILVGVLTAFGIAVVFFMLTSVLPDALKGISGFLTFAGSFAGGFIVGILLSKKRDVTIYRDKTRQEPIIRILQDKKFEWFTATFTVRDTQQDLAKFRKNYFYDIFRKQWQCFSPQGNLICMAKEDSIILALARRLLGGSFYGLLRINFIIVKGDSEQVIGEFNRKFTLFDRYVLDMGLDRQNVLDRRIAIALGVILDTGERR